MARTRSARSGGAGVSGPAWIRITHGMAACPATVTAANMAQAHSHHAVVVRSRPYSGIVNAVPTTTVTNNTLSSSAAHAAMDRSAGSKP